LFAYYDGDLKKISRGLTQDKEGSKTVLGIGPGPVALINEVTGKLRLL
jgi:peptidyl-tRNA hydrolase, PTH2 family